MQVIPVLFFIGLLCALLGGGDLERGFVVLLDLIVAILVLGVISIVVVVVLKMREPVVRWYYFTFYPHPAESSIRAALASGTVLDGTALAAVLGEEPDGDPIFRAVRAEQAEALINEMQEMTRAQMRELEARATEKYERAAAQQMQAALAEAAIALEKAKAYLSASKRR